MGSRYLPNWLYGALPYSYFGCGVFAIVFLQNRIALASGLTMILVACIVSFLRLQGSPQRKKAVMPAVDRRVIEMSWKEAYASGNPVMDEQRRRLFGLSNELVDAVMTRKQKADVELMFHDFFDHLAAHFACEEKLLAAARQPHLEERKEIHQSLLARAGSLRSQYRNGNLIATDLIGFITYDVLTNHIIREGKDFEVTQGNSILAEAWSDTEKQRRENQDTVLKMVRAEPDAGSKTHLSLSSLDKLTPKKTLFNSYPHVWQRICVFAPQPKHLERYLDSLLGQGGGEVQAEFSMQALKEIGDIYTQNLHFLAEPVTS